MFARRARARVRKGVRVNVAEQFPELPDLKILAKLGEGGTSRVWKAQRISDGQLFAVKVMNRDLAASRDDLVRFVQEEKVLENIDHVGIVKSYGLYVSGDLWYYLMEYIDGYTFNSLLIRKCHLPEVDCLLICESIALALDYAWNVHSIVHCDVKPENIMINSEGVVKLTDLGLCLTVQHFHQQMKTVPDHVFGTPAYISPEQVYGDVELDCRADIYSLAASLYHLATGRVLFPGLTSEEMLLAHCDEAKQAKDPRVYSPGLSLGFCQLLEAMLVKDRDDRMQTWRDVYDMCRDIEAGYSFKPRETPGKSSLQLFLG